MSARKTTVDTSKFEAITTKLGFQVKAKAGSFKCYPADGSIKRSLDVTTSKKGQTVQVILVGFETKEGVIAHPKPPAKTVTQMIDFSQDEKLILRAFYKACKALASLPVAAPVSAPVAEKNGEAADKAVEEAVKEQEAAASHG